MKELSIEEKARRYDKALDEAKALHKAIRKDLHPLLEQMFPELKEPEEEKIRKWLISQLTIKSDVNNPRDLELMILKSIEWLEKQNKPSIKWNENTEENKPSVNHSILMKTDHGIAEGEWRGDHWYQYRWATHIKDSHVLAWMELSDLNE